MSNPDDIRLTAEGMLRNFGVEAASRAEATALRHLKPTTDEGYKLWQAVAQEIRAIRAKA